MYVFVYIIYVTYDDIFIYFFKNHRFDTQFLLSKKTNQL